MGIFPRGLPLSVPSELLLPHCARIGSERARFVAQQAADRQERRYAQARLISAWMKDSWSGPHMRIALANGSTEPVYNVLVTVFDLEDAIPQQRENFGTNNPQYIQDATLSLLPPGRSSVRVNAAFGAIGLRPGAEVAFTDRSGVHWVRRTWGALEELPANPFQHYHLDAPIWFYSPDPE